ncbi:MAG: DUF2796 domain-containing protein [Burkholderiales bacterium]|nr:DUF2796 domain-containing protein [Burkholderiales bacterium]
MSFRIDRRALGIAALLLAACGAALAGKAHRHGAAAMDLALEGGTLTIAVEMPLDSLVGFERAPRSEAERRAADAALVRLRDGAALFRLDAAAECKLVGASVQAPVLERQPAGAGAAPGAAASDAHADLEASYVFACAQPARLATLEAMLFDAFPRLERIEVQAVLPQGQRKAVLGRKARVLRLSS